MAKKTTVKITGISEAQKNALKFLDSVSKDKEILNIIGAETANQIRARTRSRLEDYKQPPLEDSTIKTRQSYGRNRNPAEEFSPKRSNLTMSGQLLDAISYKLTQTLGEIVLYLKSPRVRAYERQGDPVPTNNQVLEDLEKQGRVFFFISQKLQTLLENRIAKELRKKLAVYNKVIRKIK